jgi:hypothetical protein
LLPLVILVAMPMVIIAIVGSSTGRLRATREQNRQGLQVEVADFSRTESSRRLAGFLASYDHVLLQPREEEASADAARLTLLKQEPPQSPLDVRLIVGPEFEVLAQVNRQNS